MRFTRPRQKLPPEWAPQSGVMLTWPHAHGAWGADFDDVERVFVNIAREVAHREKLLVVCYDTIQRERLRDLLTESGLPMDSVRLYVAPSNDVWARDHGPITVEREGRPLLLDFTFNGWGGKFPADLDNKITGRLKVVGAFGATPLEVPGLVLEGGSIESDGMGTLLTTSHCQLSAHRNPRHNRTTLEEVFRTLFGAERVLWLDHGHLAGDDTDSHIDTLARFCDSSTIVHMSCEDPADEHYIELRAMAAELRGFINAHGNVYNLVPLPLPAPQYDEQGKRLPATYANFLIINGAVLVPTYDDPNDEIALTRLAECFPNRETVGIDCRPLIGQYGSLHCVTMQFPEGVIA